MVCAVRLRNTSTSTLPWRASFLMCSVVVAEWARTNGWNIPLAAANTVSKSHFGSIGATT